MNRQKYITAVKLHGPFGNRVRQLRNRIKGMLETPPANKELEKLKKVQAEQSRLVSLVPNALVSQVLSAESKSLDEFLEKLVRNGGQAERNMQKRLKGKGDKLVHAEKHGWSFRYKPPKRITELNLYAHRMKMMQLQGAIAARNAARAKKTMYQRFVAQKTEENKKLNADIAKMKAQLVSAFGGRTGS
jgi:hypothetical protein